MLTNIAIVLNETTLAANIGSTARAMMTMGLRRLILVNPKQPIDTTSYAYAKGGTSILDNAIMTDTLDQAVTNCHLVIATSTRKRHLPRPNLTPDSCSKYIANFIKEQPTASVAIVFGREDRGLTNNELMLADFFLQIPANPDYPVLNVASSVQVVASYLYARQYNHLTPDPHHTDHPTNQLAIRSQWDAKAITNAQKQALDNALIALFDKTQLSQDNKSGELIARLSRLNRRLQLDEKEYQLLMALLHKLLQRL